uniref:Uncharacterized protein n=1 Tax=Aegilops tauschii subsp. strangulata TaxID=200361 RepID=A0A453LMT5_AEGTS
AKKGARRSLLGFVEAQGNSSYRCSPSGPCIPCQYSEKVSPAAPPLSFLPSSQPVLHRDYPPTHPIIRENKMDLGRMKH